MSLEDQIEEGARFAPTFKPSQIGDGLKGEVLAISERQATEMQSGKPLFDKNGKERMEIVVTIASHYRDWEKVAKVPEDLETKKPQPTSDDVGERNIYMKDSNRTELQKAIVKAFKAEGRVAQDLEDIVGGVVAAKFDRELDVNQPSKLKLWAFQAQAPLEPGLEQQIEGGADEPEAEQSSVGADGPAPF